MESSLKTLLYSLDPRSLSQHLAFYELYPETQEGQLALRTAWALLGRSESPDSWAQELPLGDIQPIIALATRQSFDAPVTLTEPQLLCIETLSNSLNNRTLKGHRITSREAALALSDEETDLARSLLLFQFDEGPEQPLQIRQYEANIDLMALQILARLTPQPSHEEKIRAINQFIFHEMQFRFPPHSLHAADIDLYTFLPSVLDGRQGVCLGVSILYLSLAQRLDLPLEIITPPGHIYVRYNNGKTLINIETTARGIDLPSEVYLGINTRSLQKRKMKEVIALAFMNQAAVFWTREKYKEALALYEKATPFMPNDSQLKLFKGLNSLFTGHHAQGVKLLREVLPLEEAVSSETIAEDYLQGRVDIEGMKAVFLPVDETRDSIIAKQRELEAIVKRHPQFRAGLLQLATTWLQLGRTSEARSILERYHRLDPHHCIVEYYLSLLCIERLDYTQGWHYLRQLERLLSQKNHHPKALSSIRKTLLRVYPEP
jgi:regulator of sirC expression with transglutaminase-like and TPR domain